MKQREVFTMGKIRAFIPVEIMRRQRKNHGLQRGFTLLELMISVGIMAGAILSLLGLYATYSVLIATNKNTTVVIYHAQAVLEAMRNIPNFSAARVAALYPAGTDIIGSFTFDRLGNETIFPTYVPEDPLNGIPLQVTVTVNWQEKIRSRAESLTTLMTQR